MSTPPAEALPAPPQSTASSPKSPGSSLPEKVWLEGPRPTVRVPFRRARLNAPCPEGRGGEPQDFYLYDTTGRFGDSPDCAPPPPPPRQEWIAARAVVPAASTPAAEALAARPPLRRRAGAGITQMALARAGQVTEEMEFVALRESLHQETLREAFARGKASAAFLARAAAAAGPRAVFTPERVREEVAAGRAIIPANINHPELEPMAIGRAFRVKINANLGLSSLSSSPRREWEKMACAIRCGADTVMDLSTGAGIAELRRALLRQCPVPLGTVPIYEALARVEGRAGEITWPLLRDLIIEQAEQGVDYMTLHAALLREALPLAARRHMGIVSRGGAILSRWMRAHGAENPLFTHWDEVCEILATYDVAVSIGDALRPGCQDDANDEAQFAELRAQGDLTRRAWESGVQVMNEGPGHVPMNLIEENCVRHAEWCSGAPLYTLGPLVTDIAAGYDHISSAIGGAMIAWWGASMICYVTPAEHLGLPELEDVRQGVIASRIAAHAADLARGFAGARERDTALSAARRNFRWQDVFQLSLDPERARAIWEASLPEDGAAPERCCAMCGPGFCAMQDPLAPPVPRRADS